MGPLRHLFVGNIRFGGGYERIFSLLVKDGGMDASPLGPSLGPNGTCEGLLGILFGAPGSLARRRRLLWSRTAGGDEAETGIGTGSRPGPAGSDIVAVARPSDRILHAELTLRLRDLALGIHAREMVTDYRLCLLPLGGSGGRLFMRMPFAISG